MGIFASHLPKANDADDGLVEGSKNFSTCAYRTDSVPRSDLDYGEFESMTQRH